MKKIMEKVINELTDHKAEADLIFSTSKALKMSAQNGKISEYKVSSSQMMGVRVIKDGRVGISYTESLDEESLQFMMKEALGNAEVSEPNPHETILMLTGHMDDSPVYPEEEVSIEEKTNRTLELESLVKNADKRVVSVPMNSFSENEYSSMYLSSRGRSTSYSDKSYSILTSALMDENGKKANFYGYSLAHTFKELEFQKIVDKSLFHSRNMLKEVTLPTGRYSVMFDADNLKELIGCFGNFYSAKSAKDKVNPWASKIGQNVISKDLTIMDHPLYKDSFRTSKFDSEGVERKPLTLVEEGELKSFYHNSATASYFGTKTTGHASRSAGSSLGISGTDMIIQGKNVKAMPTKYLEVIQMDGLYSGANRVNGNFSVAIKGYVWEKGERKETFGNITLSGNLPEMLNRVEVVGDKLHASTENGFFTVPLMFHDISIAGS
jgi:PmbA protein